MQRLFEAHAAGDADAVPGVSRHRGRRRRTVASASARLPPNSAAGRSSGRPSRRTARGCGRRATTPIAPPARLRPGARSVATDVCVPISRLAECVTETQRDIAERESGRADRRSCRRRQFPCRADGRYRGCRGDEAGQGFHGPAGRRALAMDGTCTGEHGVGQGKMKYLAGRASARRRWRRCAQSRRRSIPTTS